MDELTDGLLAVFHDVFDDESIELRDEMVAADVEDWDSLNHVKLVVAIERRFGVKFSNREIGSWANVGDIKKSLAAKLRG
jgi:acyl carrier protein